MSYGSKADLSGTYTLDTGAHVLIPREVGGRANLAPQTLKYV